MASKSSRTRSGLSLLVGLFLGLLIGGGLIYAHFSGFLAPVYHGLGLHGLAGHAERHQHAGHEKPAAPHEEAHPSNVPGYSTVTIPADRQQLIGVRTGTVEKDCLIMAVRTVGILEEDQTRLSRVHTRVSGWVTRVHVNYIGKEVRKGDPLLEIYSPELVATQEEYLLALEGLRDRPNDALQRRLVEAGRKRLERWGVPADEIEKLDRTRQVSESLILRAPQSGRVLTRNVLEETYIEPQMELYKIADLSVLWLQARVYEHELPHIEPGQPVQVTLPSQPGKVLEGKVSFVEPLLQEATRTARVRVSIDNPRGELKLGMYADLRAEHKMGHGLLVAESAVLRTGERAIAFRTLHGGRFEPVEVKLGARFGDRFQVLEGLNEGDEVVTSGNFLIDSESRLKSVTQGGGAGGHGGHGGH